MKKYHTIYREKTEVAYIGKVKFLGFSFYKHKMGMRLQVHPKAISRYETIAS